jgi:voltage-dependent calcium channel L type alpha-1D
LERRKKSLNYFPHDGIVRKTLAKILTHPIFERAILSIIVISTIQLAVDNPLNDPKSILSQSLSRLDYALTAVFTSELILKVIAYGFVNCGSTSFIRNYWNVVDTFVVIITVRIVSFKDFHIAFVIHSLRWES